MSNFEFLKSQSQEWARWGAQAEEYLYADPSSSVTKLRALAEAIAEEVFKAKGLTVKPDATGQVRYNFATYLGSIKESAIVPKEVLDAFYAIKDNGNEGAHKQTATMESAERALYSAYIVAHWFMSGLKNKRLVIPQFILPKPPTGKAQSAFSAATPSSHTGPPSDNIASTIPPRTSESEQSNADPEPRKAGATNDQPPGADQKRSHDRSGEQTAEFGPSRTIARSNFEFLRPYNNTLADIGREAEGLFANSFPGASAARLRLLSELLTKTIARKLGLHVALKTSFLDCIQALDEKLVHHHEIVESLDVLRQLGNVETHNFMRCAGIASEMMERSYLVASWYVKTLARSSATIPEYVAPAAEPVETVPAWKKFLGTKQGQWAGIVVAVLATIFGYYIATDDEHRWDRALRKTLGLAAFILLLILIAFPFFVLANGLTIWAAYHSFVTPISTRLGWNLYLVRALGLSLLALFFYSLWWCVSPVPRRRWAGIIVVFALAIGYNLMFNFAKKGINFDPKTGQAEQWYDVTGAGIAMFDRPGFDPSTGTPLKPVTREIAREYEIQVKLGLQAIQPVDPATHDWFDRVGSPLLWYSRSLEGKVEFFLLPGVNPRTGDPLQPVTRELQQSCSQARTPKVARAPTPSDILLSILGPAAPGNPGIVLLHQTAGDREGTDALAGHLSGVNTSAIPADVLERRGFASKFYQGDPGLLKDALSRTQLRSLVVAEVTFHCAKRSSLDVDLLSCDLTANARKYDSHGNPAGSQMLQSTGAGFTQEAALDAAAQRVSKNLSAFAKQ